MRAIDLFAGAGGVTQGLKSAGFRVVAAVERDPFAAHTFRLNHPTVRMYEADIRHLSPARMMKALRLRKGALDLLAACPPCQGFSAMRTLNGKKRNRDPQKLLVLQVLRFARAFRPRRLMVENVPGLQRDRRFRLLRVGLQRLGYRIEHNVVNAADYGVPQSRRRLVMLASRDGAPVFAKAVKRRKTVREAIGGLRPPSRSRDPIHNYRVAHSARVSQLIKSIPPNGGSRLDLPECSQLECHTNFDGYRDVYGRMAWNRPAPTITCGCINPSKGRFLHPLANRAITLREAALLQSFPRSYRFSMERGKYAVALLIGNALPPELIRRQAIALMGRG